jgi:hypothetical protein
VYLGEREDRRGPLATIREPHEDVDILDDIDLLRHLVSGFMETGFMETGL